VVLDQLVRLASWVSAVLTQYLEQSPLLAVEAVMALDQMVLQAALVVEVVVTPD
jgi:hypothetical protein